MIAKGWLLVDRYPKEKKKRDEYVGKYSKDKLQIAKLKVDVKDIEILNVISKLGICTSDQIHRLTLSDMKSGKRLCDMRLKKLYELGCIDRFFPVREEDPKKVQYTHVVLDLIGAKLINKDKFRRMHYLNQSWRHTVHVNEVVSLQYKNFDSYKTEFPIVWDGKKMIPDIEVISNGNLNFIEVDMGTEHLSILKEKCENYLEYKSWSNKEMKVIFYFKDEKVKKKLDTFISKLLNKSIFETKVLN